jgi:hypothetical protein
MLVLFIQLLAAAGHFKHFLPAIISQDFPPFIHITPLNDPFDYNVSGAIEIEFSKIILPKQVAANFRNCLAKQPSSIFYLPKILKSGKPAAIQGLIMLLENA